MPYITIVYNLHLLRNIHQQANVLLFHLKHKIYILQICCSNLVVSITATSFGDYLLIFSSDHPKILHLSELTSTEEHTDSKGV